MPKRKNIAGNLALSALVVKFTQMMLTSARNLYTLFLNIVAETSINREKLPKQEFRAPPGCSAYE